MYPARHCLLYVQQDDEEGWAKGTQAILYLMVPYSAYYDDTMDTLALGSPIQIQRL